MKQIVTLRANIQVGADQLPFGYTLEVQGRAGPDGRVMSDEEMSSVFVTPLSFFSGLGVPLEVIFNHPGAGTIARYLMGMWSRLIDGDAIQTVAIRWADAANMIFELSTANRADIEYVCSGALESAALEFSGVSPEAVEEARKQLKTMRRAVQNGINAVRVRVRGGSGGGSILS